MTEPHNPLGINQYTKHPGAHAASKSAHEATTRAESASFEAGHRRSHSGAVAAVSSAYAALVASNTGRHEDSRNNHLNAAAHHDKMAFFHEGKPSEKHSAAVKAHKKAAEVHREAASVHHDIGEEKGEIRGEAPRGMFSMLTEKEIIRPGTYFYRDQSTGVPRKLVVTPELTKHWHEQGNKMLGLGLTVPVPCEHDFDAHPMTPADKLKNNAGWVKEYRLKDGKLFGVLDVQDESVAKKLPTTIKWTSPWINSFTDGSGREWKNVISHLALTTRPRITEQAPFPSIAAALSMASEVPVNVGDRGFCLSRAGELIDGKHPRYPIAFSMWGGGIPLAEEDLPKAKKPKDPFAEADAAAKAAEPGEPGAAQPAAEPSDVSMEELLCDLLGALGIQVEASADEAQFKRSLYNAAMAKIHELAAKGQNPSGQPPNKAPGAPGVAPNPILHQEQQPMYMSLDDIQKIPDQTMKSIALAMYNENVKLRVEVETAKKTTDSLRDAKLKEANAKRATRVALLGKLSPRAKPELDAMLAMPSMALSLGDGGEVLDPMGPTLSLLEKGLGDLPTLLTTESAALSTVQHPADADALSAEDADKLADDMARRMGCPPEKKAG